MFHTQIYWRQFPILTIDPAATLSGIMRFVEANAMQLISVPAEIPAIHFVTLAIIHILFHLQTYWRQFPTLTTYPGATISDIMSFMADNGVQFDSTTSSHRPSLAGVVATGSHVRCFYLLL